MLKRMLTPLDGSDLAEKALPDADQISVFEKQLKDT